MRSNSIQNSSETTFVRESTPDTGEILPFPYLNEYHKQHSEETIAAHSVQPLRSNEEAYAQYDRLKAARVERSAASEKQ